MSPSSKYVAKNELDTSYGSWIVTKFNQKTIVKIKGFKFLIFKAQEGLILRYFSQVELLVY